jgi:meso-butanediol dehydrogenase/(S,S)-butanediol dehydrogenase/diacetyl reductase
VVPGAAGGLESANLDPFEQESASVVGLDVVDGAGCITCDVTDERSVHQGVERAVASLDGLDVGVHCAGIDCLSTFDILGLDAWNRHLAVNPTGPMLVTPASLPHLRLSGGNVVTAVPLSGIQGQPWHAAYRASQIGLLLLMKSLAVEQAAEGIRVNSVCPGGIGTDMSAKAVSGLIPVDFTLLVRMMGVLATDTMPPIHVSEAIAHLASDTAASVTGVELAVDRGTP